VRYELVKIRTSPNWYVQWFADGHSRRRSTGTASRVAAEAFLAAFRLEVEAHPSGPVSLSDVLHWYLEIQGPKMARPDSAALAVKHLTRFYGATLADDVNLANQEAYAAHRRRTVGDETIRRELSVLSAATRLAVAHERIVKAPSILSIAKAPARERYLTRDEVARLYRHMRAEPRARHLLLFTRLALATGARTGAILDLTWDRVDLARGMVWYPVPGRRVTKKGRSVVPLEPPIIRALARAKMRAAGAHVITWRGEPISRVVRAFTRHAKAAGLEGVTPHTLRHTFATWAAQAGVPLFQIGGVLGQSIQTTTARYAKHNPEAFRVVTRAVRRK
jgi:integrase